MGKRKTMIILGIAMLHLSTFGGRGHWQMSNSEDRLKPSDTSYAYIYEDFAGDWQQVWTNSNAFLSGEYGLSIDDQATSPAWTSVLLPVPSSASLHGTIWEVGVDISGNLSSGNHLRIYLGTNNANITDAHQGYHLQIDGASGNHTYKLYKQQGARRTSIFQSAPIPNQAGKFRARVKVTHNAEGMWELFADEYDSGHFEPILSSAGEHRVQEDAYTDFNYGGLWFTFTRTRINDFRVHYYVVRPYEIHGDAPDPGDPGDDGPDDDDPDEEDPDEEEPVIDPYAVIINEIMANPRNAAILPEQEYVELYNTTDSAIILTDWIFASATTRAILPKVAIPAHDYLILCRAQDTLLFQGYGRVVGLSPWPTLTNSGTTLSLYSKDERVIDRVSYTDKWYKDSKKQGGGWSLERSNPYDHCILDQNWKASNDLSGGTPGMQNSNFSEDLLELHIIQQERLNDTTIRLRFNKRLDSMLLIHETKLKYSDRLISEWNDLEVDFEMKDETTIELTMTKDVLSPGKQIHFKLINIKSCSDIIPEVEFSIFSPHPLLPGEILINEILFNPFEGGVDFVEIYNFSQKTFDLNTIFLANLNTQGQRANLRRISETSKPFLPESYLALTIDPSIVRSHYPRAPIEGLWQMSTLPNYNNDQGHVLLLSEGTVLIDSVHYWEKMHSSLLKTQKGISLERQSFERPSNAAQNFKSAAMSEGGATPGYKNSIQIEENVVDFTLQSKIFSPDGDGFQDSLNVRYSIPEANLMANVLIFDQNQRAVRNLLRNQSISSSGLITWDGKSDKGTVSRPGIYTMYIMVYNESGFKRTVRKSFVLALRF